MLSFIVEFLLSISICAFLAYFFFLSAPVEDDVESDLNSSQISHDRPRRPVNWWESFIISRGEESLVAVVYRHIRVSILDLDDVFARSPTVEGQTSQPTEMQHCRNTSRGVFGKRQRLMRQPHHPGSDFQGAHNTMRKESALWVNVVGRWLCILFLGGGTVNIDVWSDRLRYVMECVVARVNRTLVAKTIKAPDLMAPAPRKTDALGRHPHVGVLHLELGPSLYVAQRSISGITNSAIDAMQRSIKEASNLASTWAAVSAKVVKNLSLRNNSGGNSTIRTDKAPTGTNNFLVDESKAHDCPTYTSRGNTSSNNTGSLPGVGVAIPRLAGDIVSVELPSFAAVASGTAAEIHTGIGKLDPSVQVGAGVECDTLNRAKLNECIIPPSEQAAPPSLSSELERTLTNTAVPRPFPLRCFSIPICYEDQRFALDLGCCLPILSFLPAKLSIPADVLCIECVLQVRRVSFLGCLYAAFHGPIVELSFPCLPQFNAAFEVTAPQHYPRRRLPYPPSADPSSAFTTTSTMRNVTTSLPSAGSPSLVADGNFGGTDAARSTFAKLGRLELPSSATGFSYSCINEKNGKMQELVQLAVLNAVRSITYPNVLEGRIRGSISRDGETGSGPADSANGASDGLFLWTRKRATLPLLVL
ncbi:unnamed protein product [Phytomonas sp. EM1]|nr:unnamed protein product [Phytomonas sp. EM1]|eukprot:CCW62211.1 unnamed protein product [Phytomonas sp. isolate EM1]